MAWHKTIYSRLQLESIIRWVRHFIKEKLHAHNPDLPYYITIGIAVLLFVVTLNGFVELTDELAENELGAFDRSVTDFITAFRTPGNTVLFSSITRLGERLAYILISVLLAAVLYWRYRSLSTILQTVAVLILASLSNIALKRFFSRARPDVEHLVSVDSMSYPSGHSMSAMAFYGFLIYICLKLQMPGWVRVMLVVAFVLIIAGVGVSRIYLGVHYPSDVAAGFIGGLIWVSFCIVLFNLVILLRARKSRVRKSETR